MYSNRHKEKKRMVILSGGKDAKKKEKAKDRETFKD